jgi:hypothetical protein
MTSSQDFIDDNLWNRCVDFELAGTPVETIPSLCETSICPKHGLLRRRQALFASVELLSPMSKDFARTNLSPQPQLLTPSCHSRKSLYVF